MSDKCKSCGSSITWATTKAGKPIPLNIGSTDAGNIHIEDGAAHVVPPGQGEWMSHFATCPNADEHRKDDNQQELFK